MYEYLDLREMSGIPFVVTEKPIKVFRSTQTYMKECNHSELNLPENLMAYLVDESKPPYAKVQDLDGKEIFNLVWFPYEKEEEAAKTNCRVKLGNKEQNAVSLSYDFFNYRAPVMLKKDDGNVEKYRRKWLSQKLRCNVIIVPDTEIKVYDWKSKSKIMKKVKHGKLDIPFFTWEKEIENQMATFRDAMEKPDMPLQDFEITVNYDATKGPLEKYTFKVSKRKLDLDLVDAKKQFEKRVEDYVPPENPFI
jgi:hypothetical protein